MLSILIPIFNQNVVRLVNTLNDQCIAANLEYQIICGDDCSDTAFKDQNQEISSLLGVNYIEFTENVGRSKLRNKLARLARYEYLLFIDCDSLVYTKNFIAKYLKSIEKGELCVYGGRRYAYMPPDSNKRLHWQYGSEREALPLRKRQKDIWLNFQSNNFLIRADWFSKIQFDESISGYGYEDLVFSEKLKETGIRVRHIENMVIHEGLDEDGAFMNKTEKAMSNLAQLYQQKKIQSTRLIESYNLLQYIISDEKFSSFGFYCLGKVMDSLQNRRPSIFYFNLWKLCRFANYYHALQKRF